MMKEEEEDEEESERELEWRGGGGRGIGEWVGVWRKSEAVLNSWLYEYERHCGKGIEFMSALRLREEVTVDTWKGPLIFVGPIY